MFSVTKIITNNLYRKENEEEIAAQHLLEILKRNHKKDPDEEEDEARTSEYKSEIYNTTDINEVNQTTTEVGYEELMFEDDPKIKKKALRNSLEKLITLYLNKIHENSNEDYDENDNHIRHGRDLRFEEHISDQVKYNIQKRKKKQSKTVCKDSKRAIRTLDRFEIEQAIENRTNKEFNIRKLLNYR